MNSSSEESEIPVEIPTKSRQKYQKTYEDLVMWKSEKGMDSFSENVLIAYFSELGQTKSASTLWCLFSMLKTIIRSKHNIDIGVYVNLNRFLKRKSEGYLPRRSRVLSIENIKTFIKQAPDANYLLEKVILIFGLTGACRSVEMSKLKTTDVETHSNIMYVHIRSRPNKNQIFTIQDELLKVVKKYQQLRPARIESNRFFLNFKNGKYIAMPVGRHKVAAIPKLIATYLKLPNAECYTGHCLRKSSDSILSGRGANMTILKRLNGWLSNTTAETPNTTKETHIEESVKSQPVELVNIDTSIFKTSPPSSPAPEPLSAEALADDAPETVNITTHVPGPRTQQFSIPGKKSVTMSLANYTNRNIQITVTID